MATVIKNERDDATSSSLGLILGVLLALVLIVLFFVYALPALRNDQAPASSGINVDVDLPNPGSSAPAGGGIGPSNSPGSSPAY